MDKKYRALRVLTMIYRFLGGVIMILVIGAGVLVAVSPSLTDYDFNTGKFVYGPPAVGSGIGIALGGIVAGLTLYAFGELLHLFIDMEENTRHTARMLGRMNRKSD